MSSGDILITSDNISTHTLHTLQDFQTFLPQTHLLTYLLTYLLTLASPRGAFAPKKENKIKFISNEQKLDLSL
jgi:hypothetical protein